MCASWYESSSIFPFLIISLCKIGAQHVVLTDAFGVDLLRENVLANVSMSSIQSTTTTMSDAKKSHVNGETPIEATTKGSATTELYWWGTPLRGDMIVHAPYHVIIGADLAYDPGISTLV
jgi:hypothetical protein